MGYIPYPPPYHNRVTQTKGIRTANIFSIEMYQMKTKILFQSIFLIFFTFLVFSSIFYRFMYKADYQGTYGFLCLYVVHSVFWILFDPGFRLESCLAHQSGDWHSFGDF